MRRLAKEQVLPLPLQLIEAFGGRDGLREEGLLEFVLSLSAHRLFPTRTLILMEATRTTVLSAGIFFRFAHRIDEKQAEI